MPQRYFIKPKKLVLGCILAGVILILAMPHALAALGNDSDSLRPEIRHNTVYTPWGTPLRGTTISTHGNPPGEFVMTKSDMERLTQNGLNALHIYAEQRSDGLPVGASAENCDYLIDLAQQCGMMVVLTVGEFNFDAEDLQAEADFLYDFWAFYSDRYKDKPNVIFEICNEVPLYEDIAKIEANAYDIIKQNAPDTMVLFFSFSVTHPVEHVLGYVKELESLIGDDALWRNAALAFHSYECQEDQRGADYFRHVIHTFIKNGYPIMNTELPNRFEQSQFPDVDLLRVCEEEGISWLSFVFWSRIDTHSIWRGQLEAAGITWQPDYGTWPIQNALHPFTKNMAWDTVRLSPAQYIKEPRFFAYMLYSGDFLDMPNLNFGTREPLAFNITIKAKGSGRLTLYEGLPGDTNRPIAACDIDDTSGKYIEASAYLHRAISGIADIYFIYESHEEGSALYFKDWQFILPDQNNYMNPYETKVYAMDYAFRHGDILRQPNTDPDSLAPLEIGGITNGTKILYDFMGFYGRPALLHIRAMPIAGGIIKLEAGDQNTHIYELGELEITGEPGQWQEYVCEIDQSQILMFDPHTQYCGLTLIFEGDPGSELFYISEFWLEDLN